MRFTHFILTGITLSLAVGIHPLVNTSAAVDKNDPDYEACRESLNIPEAYINLGSFQSRLQDCIESRRFDRTKDSRIDRNALRIQNTLERLPRNSRAAQYWQDKGVIDTTTRVTPTRRNSSNSSTSQQESVRFNRFQPVDSRVDPRSRYTNDENALDRSPSVQRSTQYRQFIDSIEQFGRPSRRLIKRSAQAYQSREQRQAANDRYQQNLLNAIKACESITNSFQRDNCVRREMIKAGSQ